MTHYRTSIAYGFAVTLAHFLCQLNTVHSQFESTSEFIAFCTNALVADPNANSLVDSSEFSTLCSQLCIDSELHMVSDGCKVGLEFHQLPLVLQLRFSQATCANIQPVNLAELCADDIVNGTSSGNTAIYLGNPVATETMSQVRVFCGDVTQGLTSENYISFVDGGNPEDASTPEEPPPSPPPQPVAAPSGGPTLAPVVQPPVVPQAPTTWPSVGGADNLFEIPVVDSSPPLQPMVPLSSSATRGSLRGVTSRCWLAIMSTIFAPMVQQLL